MAPNHQDDPNFNRPSEYRCEQRSERSLDTGGHIDGYHATNNPSLRRDHDTTLNRTRPQPRQPALNVEEAIPATRSTPSSRTSTSTAHASGYLRTGPARNEGNPNYQNNTASQHINEYSAQPYYNQPISPGNPTLALRGNSQYPNISRGYDQDTPYLTQTPFMPGYGSVTTQPAYPAHRIQEQSHDMNLPAPITTPSVVTSSNRRIGEVHRTNTTNTGYTYLCDKCDKTFTRDTDLKRHYNGAHDPQPTVYCCPIAGCTRGQRPFDRQDKMWDHVRAAHQHQI